MPRQRDVRASFDRGELSPEFMRRHDSEAFTSACAQFRNAITLRGGGAKRRPGSTERAVLGTMPGRIHRYKGRGGVREDIFIYYDTGDARAEAGIYDTSGTLLQTITTGLPWTSAAEVEALVIASDENAVYVFHEDYATQVLTYGASGTWSRADYAFLSGIGNKVSQPFYRFAPPGVTMSVSARTGSVTLTFSSAVLAGNSTDVGTRFRFLINNEVEVTTANTTTSCTATVKDKVYPAFTLTVASNEGFKAGQVCLTDLDELACIVTGTSGGTSVSVVMFETYDTPDISSANNLVGPESKSAISAVSAAATPPATTVWDESLVSARRGYPSTGLVHRNRLIMAGFPEATNVFAASAVGALTDFNTGDALDNEAIVETLGDDPNAKIRYLASANQLLVFTDRGAYYVPEAVDSPMTPTNIGFYQIAPDAIANVPPVVAAEGVLFVDEAAKRILIATPTGTVRRSWLTTELSEGAYHLISSPTRLAIANGLDGRSERYAFCLNSDGTIVVLMYRRGAELVAMGKWLRGFGTWEDIVADDDDVIFISKAGSDYRLCDLDFEALCDDEVSFSSAVAARASQEAEVVDTKSVVHSGTLNGSGDMADYPAAAGLTIGHDFTFTLEPTPWGNKHIGYRKAGIARYWVDVLSSGAFRVSVNGRSKTKLFWPYKGGDDLEEAGKTVSDVYSGIGLGRTNAPSIVISQQKGEGAELEVRAVTLDVVY